MLNSEEQSEPASRVDGLIKLREEVRQGKLGGPNDGTQSTHKTISDPDLGKNDEEYAAFMQRINKEIEARKLRDSAPPPAAQDKEADQATSTSKIRDWLNRLRSRS